MGTQIIERIINPRPDLPTTAYSFSLINYFRALGHTPAFQGLSPISGKVVGESLVNIGKGRLVRVDRAFTVLTPGRRVIVGKHLEDTE